MPLVDDIPKRFRENLKSSRYVDIAVAWATSLPALDQLKRAVEKHNISLRIIVGTHGNATDPDILVKLNAIGQLRLFPHEGPLFHSKVYIFRGEGSVAWIGSVNFTRAGFEDNIEAVFETKQWKRVSSWFENQWNECGELPENAIEEYRHRRTLSLPPRVLREMVGRPMRDPGDRLEYLDRARNWPGYVKALHQCHKWWKDQGKGYTVYGHTRSWRHTIEHIRPIARIEDWGELSQLDVKRLLGIYKNKDLNSGLLGTIPRLAEGVFRERMDARKK